jgi:glycerol-3-phosphate O-acyltransferase
MPSSVTLPFWLFVVIALLAAWAAMERLMVPSVRWFLRQRTNRVIGEINTRLPIEAGACA